MRLIQSFRSGAGKSLKKLRIAQGKVSPKHVVLLLNVEEKQDTQTGTFAILIHVLMLLSPVISMHVFMRKLFMLL